MEVKKLSSEFRYSETKTEHLFEINQKRVRVVEVQQRDSIFDDVDTEFIINSFDRETLTQEELEELHDHLEIAN